MKELGARFVISSSWRIGETSDRLGAYLDLAGFVTNTYPVDPITKRLGKDRGEEIAEWLSRHPDITEYAIIDDDCDFNEEQLKHLVHVNHLNGFTPSDYYRLMNIFDNQKYSEYQYNWIPVHGRGEK